MAGFRATHSSYSAFQASGDTPRARSPASRSTGRSRSSTAMYAGYSARWFGIRRCRNLTRSGPEDKLACGTVQPDNWFGVRSPGDLNQASDGTRRDRCVSTAHENRDCPERVPVRSSCFAHANAAIERLPILPRRPQKPVPPRRFSVGVAVDPAQPGKVLLERPSDDVNPFRGSLGSTGSRIGGRSGLRDRRRWRDWLTRSMSGTGSRCRSGPAWVVQLNARHPAPASQARGGRFQDSGCAADRRERCRQSHAGSTLTNSTRASFRFPVPR